MPRNAHAATLARIEQRLDTIDAQLAALVVTLGTLLAEGRTHDLADSDARDELGDLLIQLRELGRKHVNGLYDLERTVGARQELKERERGA